MNDSFQSLPGAIGMYCLSLAVQNIKSILPLPVYALLSGMNASTVGIIMLAGVQLAENSIRDRLSRILIIFGACAGLCYNSLWYFPLLMLIGGFVCVVWDGFVSQMIGKTIARLKRKRRNLEAATEETGTVENVAVEMPLTLASIQKRPAAATLRRSSSSHSGQPASLQEIPENATPLHRTLAEDSLQHVIKVRVGITIIIFFFSRFPGTSESHFLTVEYSILYRNYSRAWGDPDASTCSRPVFQHVSSGDHHLWRWTSRYSSPTVVRRRPRLGLGPRFPFRTRYDPSLSRPQLQFCRFSWSSRIAAFRVSDNLWSLPRLPWDLLPRRCIGCCRSKLLASAPGEEVGDSSSPRAECYRRWVDIYSRLPTLANRLLNTHVKQWTEPWFGAMVGGGCSCDLL